MTTQKPATLGVAVITGASSGIGEAYADRLAQRGYDLLMVARRGDRLEAIANKLSKQYGVQVQPLVADLSNRADLKRVSDILKQDSRITLLVNNAGIANNVPSVEMSAEQMEAMLSLNTVAVSQLTLAVLPGFTQRKQGTIINISSILSLYTMPTSSLYSSTKAQVLLFSLGLQKELEGTGVRVQTVLPSATATDIWDKAGFDLSAFPKEGVMSTEDCVDAALAGLDQGETVTLPSVEDASLLAEFDAIREKLFNTGFTCKPASRYAIGKAPVAVG